LCTALECTPTTCSMWTPPPERAVIMGIKQRDCVGCGAPVGIIGRQQFCRCIARIRQAAAKSPCPDCGKDRILVAATGRCAWCSRRCSACGGPVRARGGTVCRPCQRRAEREAAQQPCPRCGKPGRRLRGEPW
jgi:predicted RNA-binding Zn-ribbon protein involved in translation (DUF1610 family)